MVVVEPSALEDLAAVRAGDRHSLGLKYDSTIVAWGLNMSGQCNVPDAAMLQILSVAPNPFTASTEIGFEARQPGPVVMRVYDVSGRVVATVLLGHLGVGLHWAGWDGRDATRSTAASGVYFVRLRSAAGQSRATKALLVR